MLEVLVATAVPDFSQRPRGSAGGSEWWRPGQALTSQRAAMPETGAPGSPPES